jgi:DNA-binding NtrC family response regulator
MVSEKINGAAPATHDAPALAGKNARTILIVDDDSGFVAAFAEGLRLIGEELTVYTAENGEQAAAVVRNIPVDLVITDLRMPVMDGRELLLWMAEYRPTVPVIMMSAHSDTGAVRELEAQGGRFFDKPLDFNDMVAAVSSLLAKASPSVTA